MGGLREKREKFWVRPWSSVLDVWQGPVKNASQLNERARHRNIQTQVNESDLPLKVLAEKDGSYLIQMADLTRGFVEAEKVKKIPAKKYWRQVKRFTNDLVAVDTTKSKFLSFLKSYPRVQYKWGGRTRRRMDCSACVQDVFFRTTGYLLPRNSRDQGKKGRPAQALAVGDIILFKSRRDQISHIGIVSDAYTGEVFHLSRLKKVPVFERITKMEKRYKIVDVRRLVKFHD